MCLQIAKTGFWGGDPHKVSMATPDWIIKAFEYQSFCSDYEMQLRELNKGD